ncbi:uncharacterized protein ATC70_013241 [Mucor velutinosus]|uniref:Uncharacterized protein n=1 Tax=Mucor velutinosus TaxID=708070 RepID=A0AAN7D231_9FUNG|nr:hypothetical protein ATC70_013241 [Mucor velutinosus]
MATMKLLVRITSYTLNISNGKHPPQLNQDARDDDLVVNFSIDRTAASESLFYPMHGIQQQANEEVIAGDDNESDDNDDEGPRQGVVRNNVVASLASTLASVIL